MVELTSSSSDALNGPAIELTDAPISTPAPTLPVQEDTNLTVSPRDSWLAYDLESLEGYSRMRSPGGGPDDSRRNIVLDDDGFISGEHGLPVLSLLLGSVRMPKTSSKMITLQERGERKLEAWEFPGWGQSYCTVIPTSKLVESEKQRPPKHQLDVFRSTAIAGNDLLASVLYTTGICACACGQLAPVVMVLGIIALHPYRKIFQECGTAIPLNGGVYVAMLNSSSKFSATFAASCSLISYSATAVVSAASCTSYAAYEFGAFPQLPVTIAVMLLFAVLVLLGVKDSANVAAVIFVFHLVTLFILVVCSFVSIGMDGGAMLRANWSSPLPVSAQGGVGMDLFLGYSVALLGLTGFETSANYIEEAGPFETQRNKAGLHRAMSTFEKTIDRMWALVAVINPAVCIATLGVVDLPTIKVNASVILSVVGERCVVGGFWLRRLVAIDAIVVLAGGVLTAFVGVSGLIKQLASDRCLPSLLLQQNSLTGTHHWIILGFFLLCTTLYLITQGNVIVLSGVFSIAFLLVLLMFAFANMKLKFCRPRLPRGASIGWVGALAGFFAMLVGLVGNVVYNVDTLEYFLIYLAFYFTTIIVTFQRVQITKLALYFVQQVPFLEQRFSCVLTDMLVQLKKHTVVFFAKNSELHVLNKAIIYARDNELCDRVIICHVHRRRGMSSRRGLENDVQGPSCQSRHTCGTGHADVDSDNENESPSSSAAAVGSTNTDDHAPNITSASNNNNIATTTSISMMMTPPPTKGMGRQLTIDTAKGLQLSSAQATNEQRQQRHSDLFSSIREYQHQQHRHPHLNSGEHASSHANTPQTATSRKQRSSSFMAGDRDRNDAAMLHANMQPMVDAGAHEDLASALGLPPPPPPSILASKSTSPLTHVGRKTNAIIMPTSSPPVLEDREALLQEDRQHKHDYRDYSYLTDDVDNNDDNGLKSEVDKTIHSGSNGTVTSTARGTDDDGDDVVGVGDEICKRLQENLTLLDHIYPKCKVDLLLVESDEFCPALVAQLSRDLGIQPSFMFIRCPGSNFPYNLGEFEGVRTIMQ